MNSMDDGTTQLGQVMNFLCQMKTRVEHLNRNSTLARRRASKRSNEVKLRGPARCYG